MMWGVIAMGAFFFTILIAPQIYGWIPVSEYDVKVLNNTEIKRTATVGVVEAVKFNSETNMTFVQYKTGVGLFGLADYDSSLIKTNETIIPSDFIKITTITILGSDCHYYKEGEEVTAPSMFTKIKTTGDKCGIYSYNEGMKIDK